LCCQTVADSERQRVILSVLSCNMNISQLLAATSTSHPWTSRTEADGEFAL
jgi:hypothetical protein